AEDFAGLTGRTIAVVPAASSEVRSGDFILKLGDRDMRLGREGYRMAVGPAVEISAIEPAGVFYGTRTLLQLLHQGSAIAAGEALDWPRYPERGLMVDVGRKYFTAGWIKRHIKEMAYLKMNYFHLHFSENLRFGIESESHPETVSEQHLSKDEVREIVALAGRYFITVVPEIGMPGHMGGLLASHPEFQIKDVLGQPSPNNLDVSNPDAVQFTRELIEEYLPLFPGPYWNTGGDEYLPFYDYPRYPQLEQHAQAQYGPGANGKDAVHGHINWVADLVSQHGRIARAYNDDLNGGSVVTLNPDIVVEWWTDFSPVGDLILLPSPQALLDRGHRIMNISYWPTYFSHDGAAGLQPKPDMATAYQTWE
ncbi:MAG: family 20 glycosylhydrolase, partial [Longimicrobiales bacterium]